MGIGDLTCDLYPDFIPVKFLTEDEVCPDFEPCKDSNEGENEQ